MKQCYSFNRSDVWWASIEGRHNVGAVPHQRWLYATHYEEEKERCTHTHLANTYTDTPSLTFLSPSFRPFISPPPQPPPPPSLSVSHTHTHTHTHCSQVLSSPDRSSRNDRCFLFTKHTTRGLSHRICILTALLYTAILLMYQLLLLLLLLYRSPHSSMTQSWCLR